MKSILLAALAAFFVSGCTTTQPLEPVHAVGKTISGYAPGCYSERQARRFWHVAQGEGIAAAIRATTGVDGCGVLGGTVRVIKVMDTATVQYSDGPRRADFSRVEAAGLAGPFHAIIGAPKKQEKPKGART